MIQAREDAETKFDGGKDTGKTRKISRCKII